VCWLSASQAAWPCRMFSAEPTQLQANSQLVVHNGQRQFLPHATMRLGYQL
jgi:hypothetical protein